jgi:hypothetical protein
VLLSCKAISIPELAKITPVNPPTVKRNINPKRNANKIGVLNSILPPHIVASQLNTFIPVGTAIIIVAAVKNDKRAYQYRVKKHGTFRIP